MDIEAEKNASAKVIYILVTIDTNAIINNYRNPSKDENRPTVIDHKYGFMVTTKQVERGGQGTGDLTIKSNAGDIIRMYAVSASNNFDDSILLYSVSHSGRGKVFSPFSYKNMYRSVLFPSSELSVLPGKQEDAHFWFHTAAVKKRGIENCNVNVAFYVRDKEGKSKLYGYFNWKMTIRVKG